MQYIIHPTPIEISTGFAIIYTVLEIYFLLLVIGIIQPFPNRIWNINRICKHVKGFRNSYLTVEIIIIIIIGIIPFLNREKIIFICSCFRTWGKSICNMLLVLYGLKCQPDLQTYRMFLKYISNCEKSH